MNIPREQTIALSAFRRSSQAPLLKAFLEKELFKLREAYTIAPTPEAAAPLVYQAVEASLVIKKLFEEAL
jgi:hypothetical protein